MPGPMALGDEHSTGRSSSTLTYAEGLGMAPLWKTKSFLRKVDCCNKSASVLDPCRQGRLAKDACTANSFMLH